MKVSAEVLVPEEHNGLLTERLLQSDRSITIFSKGDHAEVKTSSIKFSTYPMTEPPPSSSVEDFMEAFGKHEKEIAAETNDKSLKSDDALAHLRPNLVEIGSRLRSH